MTIDHPKYTALKQSLKKLEKVAVAFSGGVDSSFLLAVAGNVLGENAIGITIDSPALPRNELKDAVSIADFIGVKHIIIRSDEIENDIKHNPDNRCYFCKKTEFGSIKEKALSLEIKYVLDGSNADDLNDYRPGMKAKNEINILSPLLENGITKKEIREFSKALGLPTWDKPAYACLYSRIPYGKEIKKEDLQKIESAENFIIGKGIRTVRVRCHDDLARIEVDTEDIKKLIGEPFKNDIINALKSFGFHFITIDLQGYRMGSLNESLK